MKSNHLTFPAWFLLPIFCLGGCSTDIVKTTKQEEIIIETGTIAEDLLLDVGISPFDPGLDDVPDEEEGVYRQLRKAEARYMPVTLMETLQHSGQWGVVRVIPDKQSEMDIWVDAKILGSDGTDLKLSVTVHDSSGNKWYTKKYKGSASKYAYEGGADDDSEPFQGVYNKIANDLREYRKKLTDDEIRNLRNISELQFAGRFSPEAFSEYLEKDSDGIYSIKRLPADNDPVIQRIKRIRQRDNTLVDTLQEYYDSFSRQMDSSYREWRRLSYEETQALHKLNLQKWRRGLLGVAAVVTGILAQDSSSEAVKTAGQIGIGAGLLGLKSAYDKSEEAKIHEQALEELGESLNAEIEPHTLELEDRTVTLTGSVNEQYAQWRQVLHDIYRKETGLIDTP